ncbi:Eukaryotic aspartyl protease family protein, putative isoform 2 [Hibiscus syriacus]|uniref:Eukaryotic aspartyl protease family protein, putative isoform 2 n=1 Tax=Hibiscus syriacus TaxID=106335 RepID=A0A6A2Z7L5_HIBSY|nr:Eukaryotic aspartyl protease family protein, putative isoform 2 [Hibiscus syriacus]
MDLWRLTLTVVMLMNEFSCNVGNVITLNAVTVTPTGAGLYFAKLVIGNPAEEYHVQVDTGSDILWLNCVGCDKCPKESSLGIEQKLYDPKKSTSSKLVYCGDEFCSAAHDGKLENCKNNRQCEYYIVYGDGTGNGGYFVKDTIQLQQVTGNLQTAPTNGSIVFGCGSKRSGDLSTSSEAVNGIIGFGQANSSVISQLAADGKVKNRFAHCLDNVEGGGIFAIGEVNAPHMNKTRMIRKHVDDEFPVIKFHLKFSRLNRLSTRLSIRISYLVLSNKLVIYDIENQTIGWTEYNCSSFVKVKDEKAGTEYMVGAHSVSSATCFTVQAILILLSIFIHLLHFPIA